MFQERHGGPSRRISSAPDHNPCQINAIVETVTVQPYQINAIVETVTVQLLCAGPDLGSTR
jgi:hypothetical protein